MMDFDLDAQIVTAHTPVASARITDQNITDVRITDQNITDLRITD